MAQLKFQNEKEICKLLPFADQLPDEANRFFQKLKQDFSTCFLYDDFSDHLKLCLSELDCFLDMYSLRFTKEEHVALIKMMCNFLYITNLPPLESVLILRLLHVLLKKKNILTRDDLVIEWRPLYDCYENLATLKSLSPIQKEKQNYILQAFQNFVFLAKRYFPLEATKEIFDLIKPQLYPFDKDFATKVIFKLNMFLPISLHTDEPQFSYQYWLGDLMTYWTTFRSTNSFDGDLIDIIGNLAFHNIGLIDWEPYLTFLYSKILFSFNLLVHDKGTSFPRTCMSCESCALFTIFSLNATSSSLKYFSNLMQTIESFCYPANRKAWTQLLQTFIQMISEKLILRIRVEKFPNKRNMFIKVNENNKLTDQMIDQIMFAIQPMIQHALIARDVKNDASRTLTNFATIRPNIVVPMVLDSFYSLVDTHTEPIKLTATIISLSRITRFLVSDEEYPEGRTHVIPILTTVLQWIDFNDMDRFENVLMLIRNIVQVIPLVDCSSAPDHYSNLSDTDKIVCTATGFFEDFVLEFIDRIFNVIDQAHNDNIQTAQLERERKYDKNNTIPITVSIVLRHCHPNIYQEALRKFLRRIEERIYESEFTATILGKIVCCFIKVSPENSLKIFVPFLLNKVNTHLNDVKVEDENLNMEFTYYFTILNRSLNDSGPSLIPYMDDLIDILEKTLNLENIHGNEAANTLLGGIIECFATYYCMDCSNFTTPLDTPTKEHLFLRDWGKTYKKEEVQFQWHIPNEEEALIIQKLAKTFLFPQMTILHNYIDGQNVSRVALRNSLKIVRAFLSFNMLPDFDDEPIFITNGKDNEFALFKIVRDPKFDLTLPDGSNIKRSFVNILHRVQERILNVDESDTINLIILSRIWKLLILYTQVSSRSVEHNTVLENRLSQSTTNSRHAILMKSMSYLLNMKYLTSDITVTKKQILIDLFNLGTCSYRQVQIHVITAHLYFFKAYPKSYLFIFPRIVNILRLDPIEHKLAIQGVIGFLYALPYYNSNSKLFEISEIWPAIIQIQNTEEIWTISLLNKLLNKFEAKFHSLREIQPISQSCYQSIVDFCYITEVPDSQTYQKRVSLMQEVIKTTGKHCNDVLERLVDILEKKSLHWRFLFIGLYFLHEIIRGDYIKLNEKVIEFILNCLISDLIMIRRKSLQIMVEICTKLKPQFKKLEIDPYSQTFGLKRRSENIAIRYGIRDDNSWLEYRENDLPDSETQWDNMLFVHKKHLGFAAWGPTITCHAPAGQQTYRDQTLSPEDAMLFRYFSNENYVDKLISVFCIEESTDRVLFNANRCLLFKNIFRKFENLDLNMYKKHIDELVASDIEVKQKCASELIHGLIRGSKHWCYKSIENIKSFLGDIVRNLSSTVPADTLIIWTTSINRAIQGRDPRSLFYLYENLLLFDVKPISTSLGAIFYHFQLLYCVTIEEIWKFDEYKQRIFTKISQHLDNSYELIRKHISFSLKNIFLMDCLHNNYNSERKYLMTIPEFIDFVEPKLATILLENDSDENKSAEHVLQVLCKWISHGCLFGSYVPHPNFYRLLPYMAVLSNNTNRLFAKECALLLANGIILPCDLVVIFEVCQTIIDNHPWNAKFILCNFLEKFIFVNMFMIVNDVPHLNKIKSMVLRLLEDENVEVSYQAIKLLSGLIHWKIFENPQELLNELIKKSQEKVSTSDKSINLRVRNSGIFGLCAFIDAYPYTIPDFFKKVLRECAKHLNSSEPVRATINKTLRHFRRTHENDWHKQRSLFTEEELLILEELNVPPSHYA